MVRGVRNMSAEEDDLYTEVVERGEVTAGHKRRNASRSVDESADSGEQDLLEHPSSERTMHSTLYSHLASHRPQHGYAPSNNTRIDDAYEQGLEKGLELCADEQGGDAYLDADTARAIHYTTFPALSMGAVWQFLEGNYDLAGLMAEGAVMEAGWYGTQRRKRGNNGSNGFTDQCGDAAGGCSSPAAHLPTPGVPMNGPGVAA